MENEILLAKYSLGIGDRFAREAEAQLRACMMAEERGIEVIPVWNKSHREHTIIGSSPAGTRAAAEKAVRNLHWKRPYYVDADHVNFGTAEGYIGACDFFTLDVADWIGRPVDAASVKAFVERHPELLGEHDVPGIERRLSIDRGFVAQVAAKYLAAVQETRRIYRFVEERRGKGHFITEVSMDETESPQTPAELLIILAAIADEEIPAQTVAPKFTGRFNKGVDYVGDPEKFAEEFSRDVATIAFAVRRYNLPPNLKLSVHSGSDKFSLYAPIHSALESFGAGVHLKTAGTTWLEELIGLAEGGGGGLELAKDIYAEAYLQREALCAPYASVIDIDPGRLPGPEAVRRWSSEQFVSALRHNPRCPGFDSNLRQLLHVGFKVAAKMGNRYLDLLSTFEGVISKNVTENLFDRHIKPVFIGH